MSTNREDVVIFRRNPTASVTFVRKEAALRSRDFSEPAVEVRKEAVIHSRDFGDPIRFSGQTYVAEDVVVEIEGSSADGHIQRTETTAHGDPYSGGTP